MNIKKEKWELIDNKHPEYGNRINWGKAKVYYDKLLADGKHYNPANLPIDSYNWFNLFSRRNTGKTTAVIGLVLILHQMYEGFTAEYLRQYTSGITKAKYIKLFEGVLEAHFIDKVTDGEYNNIDVNQTTKDVYLVYINDAGEIVKKDTNRLLTLLAVEKAMEFKSSYNAPRSHLLIFDEYASDSYRSYPMSEWYLLHQWIATIRRSRLDYRVIMLSNTVTPYNMYLQELGVTSTVELMKEGDIKVTEADLGAKVYNHWLAGTDDEFNRTEKEHALKWHGFKAPELKAIYGGDWEIKNYLKIRKEDRKEKLPFNNIYIRSSGAYLRCEFYIVNDKVTLNLVLIQHFEKKEDSIIFSDEPTLEDNYESVHNIPDVIVECWRNKYITYSSNMAGLIWDNFLENMKK